MREFNFDGLPGPTHNYAGLSPGNLAAAAHQGEVSNPRAAALEGLSKMRFVRSLGVPQAVLPPHPRPDYSTLRRLGFGGSDSQVIQTAAGNAPELLRLCSSASAMWTANAATVAPSSDARDGRLHLTPANLSALFHRSIEAETTTRIFRAIFADTKRFVVHDPLPSTSQWSDEGAANHSRLATSHGTVHLFGWGRRAFGSSAGTQRFIARQTFEASAAVARLHGLRASIPLLWQQDPAGIDAGAFHTDVLAVANGSVLLVHEQAFVDLPALLDELSERLGPDFRPCVATNDELPVQAAVRAYPFNSQLLDLPGGGMAVIAPSEAEACEETKRYLDRVVSEDNPVREVHYTDVNQSMNNGGGPACLRLRVALTDAEEAAVAAGARVFIDDPLLEELESWVKQHYRDRLTLNDFADPALVTECHTALDELTGILRLGSVYGFQR